MKQLKKLIKEEKNAPKEYRSLLFHLQKNGDKIIIRRIIKDEQRHRRSLIKLNRRLK